MHAWGQLLMNLTNLLSLHITNFSAPGFGCHRDPLCNVSFVEIYSAGATSDTYTNANTHTHCNQRPRNKSHRIHEPYLEPVRTLQTNTYNRTLCQSPHPMFRQATMTQHLQHLPFVRTPSPMRLQEVKRVFHYAFQC